MRGEGNHKIPGSFAPENMEKTGAERVKYSLACQHEDAISIKFVSYAQKCPTVLCTFAVALRKESVDRNVLMWSYTIGPPCVALRKESVDRNTRLLCRRLLNSAVALRKESVDRNMSVFDVLAIDSVSLSARRAWIEILTSVVSSAGTTSLSARRAWIEIGTAPEVGFVYYVALRKESVDRNVVGDVMGKALAESLSARRAWIEMQDYGRACA